MVATTIDAGKGHPDEIRGEGLAKRASGG